MDSTNITGFDKMMGSRRNTLFTAKKFLIPLVLAVFLSCKKSNVDEKIPVVPVNLTINLNLPSYSALNSVGNYVTIQGGYKGIIVYRRSLSEFAAFDLACSFDPTAGGAVLTVDSSNVALIDIRCGSRFNMAYGSVMNGPATAPLRAYNAEYDGNNTVYIYN